MERGWKIKKAVFVANGRKKDNICRCEQFDKDICHVENINLNDTHAFERLFKQYYKPLCEYCEGIIADRDSAEDIVQDTFLYLWEHRGEVSITTSLKAYLYSAVRHGSVNHLKRRAMAEKHKPSLSEFIKYLQETDYSEEEEERLEQARAFLADLPEQCRKVFVMNCVEGKRYKAIAAELGISVNTVKFHLSKAYYLLRKSFNVKPILFVAIFLRKKSLKRTTHFRGPVAIG